MTDENQQAKPEADDQHNLEVEEAPDIADEGLQERVKNLEESIAVKDNELTALKEALTNAVDRYRSVVLATDSGVPDELLKGETVEDIDASLEQARRIVLKVRQQLENDLTADSVPAGAPPRTPPDMSVLSPAEKIAHALTTERR